MPTLRATVWTLTHELGSERPTAVAKRVLELHATDPRDFARGAHAATQLDSDQTLEFGPISPPWRFVGQGGAT